MGYQHLHDQHSLPREVCYSAFTALIPTQYSPGVALNFSLLLSTALETLTGMEHPLVLQVSSVDQETGFEAGPASAMPHREEPLPQEWGSTSWEKGTGHKHSTSGSQLTRNNPKIHPNNILEGLSVSQLTLQALCVGEKKIKAGSCRGLSLQKKHQTTSFFRTMKTEAPQGHQQPCEVSDTL